MSRIDSADALVQRGDQLLAAGALDAAARLYQQAIDHDGRHAEALRSLAFVLLERGEAAAALGPAERAVTEQPDLEGARGLLGNVLMALDRHAEAIPHLIFDEDREHGMTQMMRRGQVGMCYEALGELEAAEEWLRRALENDPAHVTRHLAIAWYDHSGSARAASVPADLHHTLARVLQRRGDADGARQHYHLAKRIDPTVDLDPMYLEVMTRADLENYPEERSPRPEALTTAEERLRYLLARPTYADLVDAVALLGKSGPNDPLHDGAVAEAAAAQRHGDFADAARTWVVILCLTGRGWPALHALTASDDGRRLISAAESAHRGALSVAEARTVARQLPLDANTAAAVVDLAEVFLQLDLPTGATFTEVLEAAAGSRGAELRFLLGDAFYRAGRLIEARRHLQEAADRMEACDDGDDARIALALLSRLAADEERFDEALSLLRRVIALAEAQGDRVKAAAELFNVARLLVQTGDAAAGHRTAEQLAHLMIDDPEVRAGLAQLIGDRILGLLMYTAREAGAPTPDTEWLRALTTAAGAADEDKVACETELGRKLAGDNRWAEASAAYDRALHAADFSPRHHDIWPILIGSAAAAAELGDSSKALAHLERALDLTDGDRDSERRDQVLLLLSQHHSHDDPERALAIANQVLRSLPPDAPLMLLAHEAVMQWSKGQYPEDLLARMSDELADVPKQGSWPMYAMTVATTAAHVGAALLAEDVCRDVISYAGADAPPDLHAEICARATLGGVLVRQGKYSDAEAHYGRAAEIAKMLYDVRSEASARIGLADAHLRLGHFDRAATQFEIGAILADRTADPEEAARARVNAMHMLLQLGRTDDALAQADGAIDGFTRTGRRDLIGFTIRLLAQHVEPKQLPSHLKDMIQDVAPEISALPGTFEWLYEHLFRAGSLASSERPAAAMLDSLSPVLEPIPGAAPGFVIVAHLEAARMLRDVAPSRAWLLAREALRCSRDGTQLFVLTQIRELLLDLALRLGRSSDIPTLLAALDADWRTLRATLATDADRVAVADRAARLLERAAEQTLDLDPGRALLMVDAARSAALAERISADQPAALDGAWLAPLLDSLGPAAAVLSIGILEGHPAAMLLPAAGARVRATRLGIDSLDRLLATFRREMHVFQGQGAQSWAWTARALLADVGPAIPQDATLVVVADPVLQELPLHAVALPGGQLLLERATVVYAPSLAALYGLGRRAALDHEIPRMVSVGVAFPDEARAIGIRIGALVLSGNQLDKEEVREHLADADLIHFAGHGHYDPHLRTASGLLLTTEPEADIDQIVSVHDLEAWHLHAGLVTLSACESGLGTATPSDYLGLARQLLSAGAHAVLSALWKIDDAATQAFMLRFYRELLGRHDQKVLDVAAALRRTQLAMMATMRPHEWAGFKLTGWPTLRWSPSEVPGGA